MYASVLLVLFVAASEVVDAAGFARRACGIEKHQYTSAPIVVAHALRRDEDVEFVRRVFGSEPNVALLRETVAERSVGAAASRIAALLSIAGEIFARICTKILREIRADFLRGSPLKGVIPGRRLPFRT